jgi:hypothetical protein
MEWNMNRHRDVSKELDAEQSHPLEVEEARMYGF